MGDEVPVIKFLRRKMKELTMTSGFWNFLMTLITIITLIFYFGGAPNTNNFRVREKISVKKLMAAAIELTIMGGNEVVRVRAKHDIGERSKGQTKEGANDPVTDGDMLSHRIMYNGMKKIFPGLRVVSEEHEDYDGPITLPRLDPDGLREDVSILGGELEMDRLTVWIDPLDATQEYTERLTQYVTVMVGIALDGRPIGGIIYKPFLDITNSTSEHPEYDKLIWAWKGQRSPRLSHLHILDEVELNRVYHDDEGPRVIVSRSHKGDVYKLVEKFKPPGVVTPAGGAGYKMWEVAVGHEDVYLHSSLIKKWDLCAGAAILNSLGGRITDTQGKDITFDHEWEFKHEGGIIAAKYDQPGYVQAMKILTADK